MFQLIPKQPLDDSCKNREIDRCVDGEAVELPLSQRALMRLDLDTSLFQVLFERNQRWRVGAGRLDCRCCLSQGEIVWWRLQEVVEKGKTRSGRFRLLKNGLHGFGLRSDESRL